MIRLFSKERGRRDSLKEVLRDLHHDWNFKPKCKRRDNLKQVLRDLHYDWTSKQRRWKGYFEQNLWELHHNSTFKKKVVTLKVTQLIGYFLCTNSMKGTWQARSLSAGQ